MNQDQAKDVVIQRLKFQLELAIKYIRRHVDGNTSMDDRFMLIFADACEDAWKRADANAVLQEWELLVELRNTVFPYFNYLNNTGKHDRHYEDETLKIIDKLYPSDTPLPHQQGGGGVP